MNKAVTCHAGARDSYQLSISLQKSGLLERLVTDLFLPPILGKFLKKKFSSEIPYKNVENLYYNLIRQKLFHEQYSVTDKKLSLHALKVAIQNNSNLFLYSYTANEAFKYIKNRQLENKCFLFQLHPHPLSIRRMLQLELQMQPNAKASILMEPEMKLDDIEIEALSNESRLADNIIVASSFTKKTLIDQDVSADKITVIPYGVDHSKFPSKKKYDLHDGTIKLLFVGQMIQRKGLSYLFEALKQLNSPNIHLTLIGRGVIDFTLINEYKKFFNINVKINLSHSELINEMQNNDLFVFPSLIEGFGHVILEAMSSGLPILCTPNTAGPDIFINGNEGVIVPIRNSDQIAEKIEYFINNKKELAGMGQAATNTAKIFSWEKFQNEIIEFYTNFS